MNVKLHGVFEFSFELSFPNTAESLFKGSYMRGSGFSASLAGFRYVSTIEKNTLLRLGMEDEDADLMMTMVNELAIKKDTLYTHNWKVREAWQKVYFSSSLTTRTHIRHMSLLTLPVCFNMTSCLMWRTRISETF